MPVKSTTKRRWPSVKFSRALKRSDLSSIGLAKALSDMGYSYSPEAVRSWCRPERNGPKHPVVAQLVWKLLEK